MTGTKSTVGVLLAVALVGLFVLWSAGAPGAIATLTAPRPYQSSGGAVERPAAAPAVALPGDVPPEAIDWSAHSRVSHPGVAAAIAAAISTGLCHPDVRFCAYGTVYLVCWGLHGSNGIVPLVPHGERWVAKTAFWATQDSIKGLFEDEGCNVFGDLAILPLIDWEGDDE